MQFTTIILTALSFTTAVMAAPTTTAYSREKRASLKYCNDITIWGPENCSKLRDTHPWAGYDHQHMTPLKYGVCYNLHEQYDNKISSYSVSNMCCRFYDDKDCKGTPLFTAENRSDNLDHGITKAHNDIISSYKCDEKC